MAVLIEAISVVLRCESIAKRFAGGTKMFLSSLPNNTLCSDGELASISFMAPARVQAYVEYLVSQGLVFKKDGAAVDLVVVDQRQGMTCKCDWAIFGEADWRRDPACPISVCQHVSSKINHVVVPEGWTYASSLTANNRFVGGESIPSGLKFVRHDGDIDVLRDEESGQEFYVRRS